MASIALLRRISSSALSSPQTAHSVRHSRAIWTLAAPQVCLPQSRHRAGGVVRIRGLAGEGGASEKDEATSSGENGKSGAAVADSSSSSGSTKGFGASARPGAAKPASKDKKKPTIRRSAPEKPLLQSAPADNQVSQLETAYVVSLTILFGLIFVEGIALAASGALPANPNP